MHTLIDISMPICPGMPVYKNKEEKQPVFETTSDFATASAHETRLHMDAHTGTHIDAPLHMLEGGATIESIPLTQLVRSCRVVDLTSVRGGIGAADLDPVQPLPGEFLLFKTRNSWDDTFNPEFVYVAADAAERLAAAGVAGVGIDGLGIERAQPGHETHKRLMNAGVVIIEGLRLAGVATGVYTMVAAPLALLGIDAAPARVFLLAE